MLVPYTPISELSEEEKRKATAQQCFVPKDGFIIVNGKVVNVNELKGLIKPPVRQNLFE